MNLLSTTQAAELLGVNDSRVRQLVRAGKLPAMQIGRAYLIREEDLKLVADRKPGRPAKQSAPKPSPSANVQTAKPATAKKKGRKKQAS